MLHKCYALITLLIIILYRILRMSKASHVKGLIPMGAKHTVGILFSTNNFFLATPWPFEVTINKSFSKLLYQFFSLLHVLGSFFLFLFFV